MSTDVVKVCPVCNNALTRISYFDGKKLNKMNLAQRDKWAENKIGHPISEEAYRLREKYVQSLKLRIAQRKKELARIEAGYNKSSIAVACPYCHSTNTNKISFLSKYLSASTWGILAVGEISKQWHCNNCKSDF